MKICGVEGGGRAPRIYISALDRGEYLKVCPGDFTPRVIHPVPTK